MKSVDAITLKDMVNKKADFLLIDVREPHEHAAFNIGGELIPLSEILSHMDKYLPEKRSSFIAGRASGV